MLRVCLPVFVGLFAWIGLLFPVSGQTEIKSPFVELDWIGYNALSPLRERVPETNYIAQEDDWFSLWKSWRTDPVPEVDFSRYFIVVETADGENKVRLAFDYNAAEEQLVYRLSSTAKNSLGFSYGMKMVRRDRVKKLNDHVLPPAREVDVSRIDIPDTHFTFRRHFPFAIRSYAERDTYLTLHKGAWGVSSEPIRQALKIRNIDFDKQIAIFLFAPQDEDESPTRFHDPAIEESRLIFPVDAPEDVASKNLDMAGFGFLINQTDKDLFYRLNGTLKIIKTLEGDVGQKTYSSVRRYKLQLQSPIDEERIKAAVRVENIGIAAHEAIPQLIKNLAHDNPDVQLRCGMALRNMGIFLQKSEKQLDAMVHDEKVNENGRRWAQLVLNSLTIAVRNRDQQE